MRGAGKLKINNEENLIRKMTNDGITTNGQQIASFFPTLQDHRFHNDLVFEDDILKNNTSIRHHMNKLVLFKNV